MFKKGLCGVGIGRECWSAVKKGPFTRRGLKGLSLLGHKGDLKTDGLHESFASFVEAKGAMAPSSLSLSIPLSEMVLMTVQLPPVPQEAVAGALNFQVKKTFTGDLDDYTMDYLETHRDQGGVAIECYFLPKVLYEKLNNTASKADLRIRFLEPDLFSIFEWLAVQGKLQDDGGAMALILWPDSVSIGVFKGDRIRLSRSVNTVLPKEVLKEGLYKGPKGQGEDLVKGEDANEGKGDDHVQEDILSLFGVNTVQEEQVALELEEKEEGEGDAWDAFQEGMQEDRGMRDPMDAYASDVLVQAMRTRDYFSSIMKLGSVDQTFIFGPQDLEEVMVGVMGEGLGGKVEFLGEPTVPMAMGAVLR